MKSLYFLFFILTISLSAKAQIAEYTPLCQPAAYCLGCADIPAHITGTLRKELGKPANWKKLEDITGAIVLDVVVDSTGKACCIAVRNYTLNSDSDVIELGFQAIANKYLNWKPATKNGVPVSSIISVAIYCRVKNRRPFDAMFIKHGQKVLWEPTSGQRKKQVIDGTDLDDGFDKREKLNH